MRNLLGYMAWTLLAVAISIPCPAQAPAKASADKNTVRDKLVGAWRLAWEEEPGADGKIARVERTGTLLYTRDGHMSVQIMLPTPESSSASGPVQYEQNGYEGYFGTYEVDVKSANRHPPRRRRAGAVSDWPQPDARVQVLRQAIDTDVITL